VGERESAGMDRVLALLCTLAVGALIAFQPPSNALLARHVGDLGAAFTSLVISTAIVGVLLVAVGHPADLGGLSGLRPEHVIGGIGGAAIVLVTIITVRPLGAGALAAALVTTQLIASVLIDRFGWLGLDEGRIGLEKLAGVALLIAGTVLVTLR
jgi:transporter family-2 protein